MDANFSSMFEGIPNTSSWKTFAPPIVAFGPITISLHAIDRIAAAEWAFSTYATIRMSLNFSSTLIRRWSSRTDPPGLLTSRMTAAGLRYFAIVRHFSSSSPVTSVPNVPFTGMTKKPGSLAGRLVGPVSEPLGFGGGGSAPSSMRTTSGVANVIFVRIRPTRTSNTT
jgi:hypothetical protein